jgi:FixJ family two-component response regulator
MATPLIAVVDDDPSVRKSLSSLLRSVGFAVQVFESAEEFVASDDLARTGCTILDVRMPGMSGLELQRRLALTHPHLPVVFITAHASDEEVRSRALKDGAVDYLSKPLSEEALLGAVQAALDTKMKGGP